MLGFELRLLEILSLLSSENETLSRRKNMCVEDGFLSISISFQVEFEYNLHNHLLLFEIVRTGDKEIIDFGFSRQHFGPL